MIPLASNNIIYYSYEVENALQRNIVKCHVFKLKEQDPI